MVIEVKVPSPGESITEVEIEAWLVENGAFVEMDAELAEINSDKATLTVNAETAGVVQIIAQEGDTVEVGQVIAKIDSEGALRLLRPHRMAVRMENLRRKPPALPHRQKMRIICKRSALGICSEDDE